MNNKIKSQVIGLAVLFFVSIASIGVAVAWHSEPQDWVFNGIVKFMQKADLTSAKIPGASPLKFEGATEDAFQTTFAITDPTAARTITFPNGTGTVPLASSANGSNATVGEFLLSATTISAAADGNTTIFTVPSGVRAVLTKAVLVAAADFGGNTTMTIGQAGALTDFLGTQTLSNLDAQYDVVILQPVPNATPVKSKSYAASTVIKAVIGSHTGSAGNTLYLYGFMY